MFCYSPCSQEGIAQLPCRQIWLIEDASKATWCIKEALRKSQIGQITVYNCISLNATVTAEHEKRNKQVWQFHKSVIEVNQQFSLGSDCCYCDVMMTGTMISHALMRLSLSKLEKLDSPLLIFTQGNCKKLSFLFVCLPTFCELLLVESTADKFQLKQEWCFGIIVPLTKTTASGIFENESDWPEQFFCRPNDHWRCLFIVGLGKRDSLCCNRNLAVSSCIPPPTRFATFSYCTVSVCSHRWKTSQ